MTDQIAKARARLADCVAADAAIWPKAQLLADLALLLADHHRLLLANARLMRERAPPSGEAPLGQRP